MTSRFFTQADMDREVPLPPNVIPIGAAKIRRRAGPTVNHETVGLLERMLERAKRGHVVGVAIASSNADGSTGTAYACRNGSLELLLAAFFRLRLRLDDLERSTD